ncbi:hypothetical protein [Gemmobacter sp. 24YEA27]|uniref:hypothetical protein n=1 Tax=Gemmobacter sp. 24YEA27 TaxID=3040672 RepID=UPI0024B3A877|nr:hypothetical protein [Gemmobacter sp. 24YEA27]
MQRYDQNGEYDEYWMYTYDDGEYVRFSDAQAEIARLTAERDARDRAKVAEGMRMALNLMDAAPVTAANRLRARDRQRRHPIPRQRHGGGE